VWFLASLLPINKYAQKIIQDIQKECTDFFWAYKQHKLRYSNLMLPMEQGGFKLWNLQDKITSLQAKWMSKFEDSNYQALWKKNLGQIFNNIQTKVSGCIPLSHSKTDWYSHRVSSMAANLLKVWTSLLNRSPLKLTKGRWAASLSKNERPHWMYTIQCSTLYQTEKEGQTQSKKYFKTQQTVPKVPLLWYPNNNLSKQPQEHWEYASALVPAKVKIVDNIVLEAIALFPPIAFVNAGKNNGEQHIMLINKMDNKDYYAAVHKNNNNNTKSKIKQYTLFHDNEKKKHEAFKNNHHSNLSGNIRQTRWLVLTHSLPVCQRMHKMNPQWDNKCPACGQIETIRHCLISCQRVQPIWQWFRKIWHTITTQPLPLMHDDVWLTNTFSCQFQIELTEVNDIITHILWTNRNKLLFNNKQALNEPQLIQTMATAINTHIRKMTQKQASLYDIHMMQKRDQETTYLKTWTVLWARIRDQDVDDSNWRLLQATEGEHYCALLLHNPLHIYTYLKNAFPINLTAETEILCQRFLQIDELIGQIHFLSDEVFDHHVTKPEKTENSQNTEKSIKCHHFTELFGFEYEEDQKRSDYLMSNTKFDINNKTHMNNE
jgi:hypothetical protein